MKTVEECKKEMAARFAHPDWNAVLESLRSKESNNDIMNYVIDGLIDLCLENHVSLHPIPESELKTK